MVLAQPTAVYGSHRDTSCCVIAARPAESTGPCAGLAHVSSALTRPHATCGLLSGAGASLADKPFVNAGGEGVAQDVRMRSARAGQQHEKNPCPTYYEARQQPTLPAQPYTFGRAGCSRANTPCAPTHSTTTFRTRTAGGSAGNSRPCQSFAAFLGPQSPTVGR
jgi:hypothetical protein